MTDKFKQMVQLSDKTVLFFYSAFDLPVSFFFFHYQNLYYLHLSKC